MRKVALSFERYFFQFYSKDVTNSKRTFSLGKNDFHFYKELYIKKALFSKTNKNAQGCAKFLEVIFPFLKEISKKIL